MICLYFLMVETPHHAPFQLAWSITNVEDDLPLGFKWFGWYGKNFMSVKETIPIYGDERGQQQYSFEILDSHGDGMCCDHGQGSYSLYLGYPDNPILITAGGEFTFKDSYSFEINSSGLVKTTSSIPIQPSPKPTVAPTSKPTNPPLSSAAQSDDPPTKKPTLSFVPARNSTIDFAPVTGSFTCNAAGLTCTITCFQCGSIKREATGMSMDFINKSTITYTAERGTLDSPENPSLLVLVESDNASSNSVSCDDGCICNIVNESVLGCGITPKLPTVPDSNSDAPSVKPASQPIESPNNGDAPMDPPPFLTGLLIISICTVFFR